MTRESQKREEKTVVDHYLDIRGIQGTLVASERPDFLVTTASGMLGVEVTAYHGNVGKDGGSKGREVESTWEALLEFAATCRQRFPDVNRLNVWLNFRTRRVPPRTEFEPFCSSVVAFLQRNRERVTSRYLDIRVDEASDGLLARYVSRVTVKESKAWVNWYWPAHNGGGVGTSDHELMAVVSRKVESYKPPHGLLASHLVIYGGGPGLSRIAAPYSAEQLDRFPMVSAALTSGPFDEVAILDLRNFIWVRGKGWRKLVRTEKRQMQR